MGDFNVVNTPKPLKVRLSHGALTAAWLTERMTAVPYFLINLQGHCTHASDALATLLQCGVDELRGFGWRPRVSPYAGEGPFNLEKIRMLARTNVPLRLLRPDRQAAIVTRLRPVTDPADPETVTGFCGRVQLVRLHRTASAVAGLAALIA